MVKDQRRRGGKQKKNSGTRGKAFENVFFFFLTELTKEEKKKNPQNLLKAAGALQGTGVCLDELHITQAIKLNLFVSTAVGMNVIQYNAVYTLTPNK